MKMMVIPIVISALGTVTKEELEIIRRVEISQITALLRSARILSRVPVT